MRRLIALVLVAALAWSGVWVLGARGVKAGFEGWLAAERAAGRTARADLRVHGFPFRFDTTFADLAYGDPGRWLWTADRFQTLMLSYAPNRAVAAWPGPQRIETPLGTVDIEGEAATASVRVGASLGLPLERAALVARSVTARGAAGTLSVGEARVAAEREDDAAYHLGLLLTELALPPGLALGDALPPAIDLVRIDASAQLDAPLDRGALAAPPVLRAVEVADARLDWGEARVRISGGPLEIGRDGTLSGSLDLRVVEWPRLVDAAVAAGLLPERQAPLTRAAFEVIAGTDAAPGTIETQLVFELGFVRLGPLPLGPAPRLQRQ